jgi:hypothetical protein
MPTTKRIAAAENSAQPCFLSRTITPNVRRNATGINSIAPISTTLDDAVGCTTDRAAGERLHPEADRQSVQEQHGDRREGQQREAVIRPSLAIIGLRADHAVYAPQPCCRGVDSAAV